MLGAMALEAQLAQLMPEAHSEAGLPPIRAQAPLRRGFAGFVLYSAESDNTAFTTIIIRRQRGDLNPCGQSPMDF